MSTTFETAALWSATQLATDQSKIGAAGLSIRQRKLLTLLSQPMSVAQLASSIALPIEDVHAALDRFAKLGLVRTDNTSPAPLDPMQLRVITPLSVAAETAPSRMPMLIGVAVAALALVAAAAWLLRGSSSATPPAQVASATQSPVQAAPTVSANTTGSVDSGSTVSATVAQPKLAAAQPPLAPFAAKPLSPTVPPAQTKAAAEAPVAAPATKAATPTATAATVTAAAPTTPAPLAVAPATSTAPAILVATPSSSAAPTQTNASAPAPATSAAAPALPSAAAPVTTPVATATVTAPATVAPPPARSAPAARDIKLVTRVEPLFPRGFDDNSGTVRARLQVDARGTVTGVDIVEANPPRVFDRSVRTALQQWRYEPTGEAFSTMAEIIFRR